MPTMTDLATTRITLVATTATLGFGLGAAQATPVVSSWTYVSNDTFLGTDNQGSSAFPFKITASGQFTVDSGVVQSISGTFGWEWLGPSPVPLSPGQRTIDSLLAAGLLNGNDNAYPISAAGLAFSLTAALPSGATKVYLSSIGGSVPWQSNLPSFDSSYTGTFSIPSAVPEPASAGLLGLAVAGLLGAASRRRRAAA